MIERYIIIGAVVGQVILMQINKLVGSVCGVLLAVGVGLWGHFLVYQKGGVVLLLNYRLREQTFLIIMGVWLLLNLSVLISSLRTRAYTRRKAAHLETWKEDNKLEIKDDQ